MAKRTRYTGRPSGKRPATKPTGSVAAARTTADVPALGGTTSLTAAEIARAEVLEAEIATRERAAIAANARHRTRSRLSDPVAIGDVNAPLSVRAAHEYAYVARDVRRIILTGGLMVLLLAILDVLVNVLKVIKL